MSAKKSSIKKGGKTIESTSKRAGNVTEAQKKRLREYMEDNPDMITSKFSNAVTREKITKQWDVITAILNAEPGGAVKERDQWKRTWADMKKNVSKKIAANKQNLRKTGGGPPENVELSPEEQHICDMIPAAKITGDPKIQESIEDPIVDDMVPPNFSDNSPPSNTGEMMEGIVLDIFKDNEENSSNFQCVINSTESSVNELSTVSLIDTAINQSEVTINQGIASPSGNEVDMKKDIVTNEEILNVKEGAVKIEEERKKTPWKIEKNAFPSKKRSMAVHRQEATLRNSENVIAISTAELEAKKAYYNEKLTLLRQKIVRKHQVHRRVLQEMGNKLTRPWK